MARKGGKGKGKKTRKPKAGKNKFAAGSAGTLGQALIKGNQRNRSRRQNVGTGFGVADAANATAASDRLRSVTDMSSLEDFVASAVMADRSFVTERTRMIMMGNDGKVYEGSSGGIHERAAAPAAAAAAAATAASQGFTGPAGVRALRIPRRPRWREGMSAAELQQQERDSFLQWRRAVASLEEQHASLSVHAGAAGGPGNAVVTPFEKNLEVWRQLWRVVERSDVVVQVVDARNPLLFRCPDVNRVAAEINPNKECLLVINKADYLSESQRRSWAEYFLALKVEFVFFSAVTEQDKLDEADRAIRDEEEGLEVLLGRLDKAHREELRARRQAQEGKEGGGEGEEEDDGVGSTGAVESDDGEEEEEAGAAKRRAGPADEGDDGDDEEGSGGVVVVADPRENDLEQLAADAPYGGEGMAPSQPPAEEVSVAARAAAAAAAEDGDVDERLAAKVAVLTRDELMEFFQARYGHLAATDTAGPMSRAAKLRHEQELAREKERRARLARIWGDEAVSGFERFAALPPAPELAGEAVEGRVEEPDDRRARAAAEALWQRLQRRADGASAEELAASAAEGEEAEAARRKGPGKWRGGKAGARPADHQGPVKASVRFAGVAPEDEEERGVKGIWDDDEHRGIRESAAMNGPRPLTIGTIGYPNVGKSSLVNVLLGATTANHSAKRVGVGSTPGKTKHFQTLEVDETLTVCDCPGLVFPSFVTTRAEMVVNGVLPIDQMREYIQPSVLLADRVPRHVWEETYGLEIAKPRRDEDPDRKPTAREVLDALCFARSYMATAHAGPDHPRAARQLIKDYCYGRVLYCHPPPGHPDPSAYEGETTAARARALDAAQAAGGGRKARKKRGNQHAAATAEGAAAAFENVLVLEGEEAQEAVAAAGAGGGGEEADALLQQLEADMFGVALDEEAEAAGEVVAGDRAFEAAAAGLADPHEEAAAARRARAPRVRGIGKRRGRKATKAMQRETDPYGTQHDEYDAEDARIAGDISKAQQRLARKGKRGGRRHGAVSAAEAAQQAAQRMSGEGGLKYDFD